MGLYPGVCFAHPGLYAAVRSADWVPILVKSRATSYRKMSHATSNNKFASPGNSDNSFRRTSKISRLFNQNHNHSLWYIHCPIANAEGIAHMSTAKLDLVTKKSAETLTETLKSKLNNPQSSSDFDLHGCVNDVLKDLGLTAADSGGKLTFYGQDPIIPSPHRFGAMAAVGLAARSVALAALWKDRTGEGQHIHMDV